MIEETFHLKNEEEMNRFVHDLFLRFKDEKKIYLLYGTLGAGKTTFAKAFAKEIGIKEVIKSPTFIYKSSYLGLVHYDLYQASKKQLNQIKRNILSESQDNYVLVEWAQYLAKEKFIKKIDSILKINIKIEDINHRIVMISD